MPLQWHMEDIASYHVTWYVENTSRKCFRMCICSLTQMLVREFSCAIVLVIRLYANINKRVVGIRLLEV